MKLCLMTVRSTFYKTFASDILRDLNKEILLRTGHGVFTRFKYEHFYPRFAKLLTQIAVWVHSFIQYSV